MNWRCEANQNDYPFLKWMTIKPHSGIVSIQTWLTAAYQSISGELDFARNDLRVLLADRLQVTPAWVAAHPEFILQDQLLTRLEEDLQLYRSGSPLPYLLGRVDFFGRELFVTEDVLIPRPETELLVEYASVWLKEHPTVQAGADVGTGSGCIPVSLAGLHPGLTMVGIDVSLRALRIANVNLKRYGFIDRIRLVQGDLLSALDLSALHLVTANLPYIPSRELLNLEVSKHEPILALDGGPDGADLIRRLLEQLSGRLQSPYCILLEMECGQAQIMRNLVSRWFPEAEFEIIRDFASLDRLVLIRGEA